MELHKGKEGFSQKAVVGEYILTEAFDSRNKSLHLRAWEKFFGYFEE